MLQICPPFTFQGWTLGRQTSSLSISWTWGSDFFRGVVTEPTSQVVDPDVDRFVFRCREHLAKAVDLCLFSQKNYFISARQNQEGRHSSNPDSTVMAKTDVVFQPNHTPDKTLWSLLEFI